MLNENLPQEFVDDLFEFAKNWIPDVQMKIAKRATDIYNDETMRGIVCQYAKLSRSSRKERTMNFSDVVYGFSDKVWESSRRHDVAAYSRVLYDMLCK